ncbi:MAG: hypothetical protein KF830_13140 [Planctomycetes bacterium]|nr:hypothetical protein [Planctomycetota bacterium]
MQKWRRRGIGTPAGWYTLLGVLLLAGSLQVPLLTAERTARVEQRAEQIAGLLLAATLDLRGPLDAWSAELALARFHQLALRDQVHVTDLEPVEPAPPDTLLALRNKHYAFHLAVSPPDPAAPAVRGGEPAYEAMAWPLEPGGPGHSAFLHADDAPRAYSRNLNAGYLGLAERRPRPGRSHRRATTGLEGRHFYRSLDDERWIVF